MRIPVMYINGTVGEIRVQELDELLELKVISSFRRASGWATVGRDEVRHSRVDDGGSWRDRKNNRRLLPATLS